MRLDLTLYTEEDNLSYGLHLLLLPRFLKILFYPFTLVVREYANSDCYDKKQE